MSSGFLMRALQLFWDSGLKSGVEKDVLKIGGGENNKTILVHCIDFRRVRNVVHSGFISTAPAAALRKWDDPAKIAVIANVGFPLLRGADTVIIAGHKHCLAVEYFCAAIMDGTLHLAGIENDWMRAFDFEGLREAISGAWNLGLKSEVVEIVNKIISLKSAIFLHDYVFNETSMKDMLHHKHITVVNAFSDTEGGVCQVFYPEMRRFLTLQECYSLSGNPDAMKIKSASYIPDNSSYLQHLETGVKNLLEEARCLVSLGGSGSVVWPDSS